MHQPLLARMRGRKDHSVFVTRVIFESFHIIIDALICELLFWRTLSKGSILSQLRGKFSAFVVLSLIPMSLSPTQSCFTLCSILTLNYWHLIVPHGWPLIQKHPIQTQYHQYPFSRNFLGFDWVVSREILKIEKIHNDKGENFVTFH